MERRHVTFDFSDHPELLNALRMTAARENTSQKAVVVEALKSYFAQKQENLAMLLAAENTFAEWDNEEDRVYDSV